jgi:hypothetical protein
MRNKHRIGKHANVGFENLARLVGENWRKVDPALKKDLLGLIKNGTRGR